MKILIVGMGLIGGSVCKALKNKTQYEVYGCDVDEAVLQQALQDHAIDATAKQKKHTIRQHRIWKMGFMMFALSVCITGLLSLASSRLCRS